MAITTTAYGPFLASLGQASVNFGSDNFWVALFQPTYTPDYDYDSDYFNLRHDFELSDAGDGVQLDSVTYYTWNGQQLKNTNWNYDPVKKAAIFTADNVSWSNLTGTFRYALVYKWVPQSIDNVLIGCLDYGSDQVYSGSAFTIDFTDGVVAVAQ
jgi:hypothetical protein